MNTTRLEAFSDGVIAILITIMVLELKVPEGTRLEALQPQLPIFLAYLARLIEAYESIRWPRRLPSLPDLLTYVLDQHGVSRADLVPLLGTPSRVSEVMNGKRHLSMSMVRKLRDRFHIPADLLIPPARRRLAA